ncbi:phage tail protein [Microvirga zambiensis]|uniref:phage tail protein n=1 Tax=Microvirga zambiensis TaxID=1402137 RepID=UPI00191D7479|nr:phage tail protein [Microvirga zambiensis]
MAVHLRIDTVDISRLANMIAAAGDKAPVAIARAINRTGGKARTAMIRSLTAQTGLKRKVVVRALRTNRATRTNLEFSIDSSGGNIRLKYFDPKETRSGVSAKPFGRRQVFPGTFMKGGSFPKRTAIKRKLTGGHVYRRTGGGKWPVEQARSGVVIPEEMVQGATEDAFFRVAQAELPGDIAHELGLILGGHVFKTKGGKVF